MGIGALHLREAMKTCFLSEDELVPVALVLGGNLLEGWAPP
jgi:hypothetical protein